MGYSTMGRDLITAGEMQIITTPKTVPPIPRPGVLYVHGAGAGADHALAEYGNQCVRTQLLSDAGFTGVSGDFGGPQTWGNDAAMSSMTAAYEYLQTLPGVKPGKVVLVGGSMGGLGALVWTAANPDKVACLSLTIPVMNPNDIYLNNRWGYTGLINTAYGGWSQTVWGPTRNPSTMAASGLFAGIPIQISYGLADDLCLPVWVEKFAATVGDSVELIPITDGHTKRSYELVDRPREAAFIIAHSEERP